MATPCENTELLKAHTEGIDKIAAKQDRIEDDSLEVSGTALQARLTGGAEGVRYLVEFRAATSTGNLYEQDVLVGVSNG
jgi:hypothetical protein